MKRKDLAKKWICLGIISLMTITSGCTAPASKEPDTQEVSSSANSDTSSDSVEKEKAAEELKLETEYNIEEYGKFTVKKLETTKEIHAAMGSGIYYKNSTDGETYVDIILEYTNLASQSQRCDECVVFTAEDTAGNQYTNTMYAVENNDSIANYEDIQPMTTVRLHCAVSIPEKAEALTLHLAIGENTYSYSYKLGETVANTKELKVGDKLEAEDFASIKYIGTEYTDDLLPSNTSGSYGHYQIDNKDNTYLVVKFDVTNQASSERECDQFLGLKAIYAEKYMYTGFVVKEESDGTGFDSYSSLSPLETGHIYFLVEVPKSIIKESATLQIFFDGNEYQASVAPKK